MEPDPTLKVQRECLQAYSTARGMLERHRQDPRQIAAFVDVAWEFLSEGGRFQEIANLLQNGLSHIALGLQRLTEEPPGPEAYQGPRVVIAWSSARQKRPCGVCGRPDHEDDIGPQLFIEGSAESVCRKCGAQHAPALNALLDILHKNPKFVTVLEELRQEALRQSTRDF